MIINEINFLPAVYCVRGPDSFSYLQGQFSQDLKSTIGEVKYGLWLNEKGRVLADSLVLRTGAEEFLAISCYSHDTKAFGDLIARNIIADEVDLQDRSEAWGLLQILGDGASTVTAKVVSAFPAPGKFLESGGAYIFAGGKSASETVHFLVPTAAVAEWRARLVAAGAVAADADAMRRGRMEAGMVEIPAELGPGDLPHEGGLGDIAVSYTKGCYLGQEVTNRLKTMGQVRRALHLVRGTGAPPAVPAALHQQGKRLGELRSAAAEGDGFVGVAMLTRLNLDPAMGLSLRPGGAADIRIGRAL
jgi:hypothetical protein